MAEPNCPANAPLSSESMAAKQPKTTPVWPRRDSSRRFGCVHEVPNQRCSRLFFELLRLRVWRFL